MFVFTGCMIASHEKLPVKQTFTKQNEVAYDTTLEGTGADGKLYGVAVDCNPMVLWYNKKLLQDAGWSHWSDRELMRRTERMRLKPNLVGSAGLRIYIRIVPICAAPSGAGKRTVHRTCKRSLPLPLLQAR